MNNFSVESYTYVYTDLYNSKIWQKNSINLAKDFGLHLTLRLNISWNSKNKPKTVYCTTLPSNGDWCGKSWLPMIASSCTLQQTGFNCNKGTNVLYKKINTMRVYTETKLKNWQLNVVCLFLIMKMIMESYTIQ